MKIIGIRFDSDMYKLLRVKAEQQNINLSKYLRSLIEKGLAVENQKTEKKQSTLLLKVTEATLENLALTQYLLNYSVRNVEQTNKIISDAKQSTKEYIEKNLLDK